jgi:hypothetical protein
MTIPFPSVEWFTALARAMDHASERYRRLGTIDLVLVAKIDFPRRSDGYEITFSGHRCIGVRRLDSLGEASPGAVVLEGPYAAWREMIRSAERDGKADLAHTLNTLTLADEPMRVTADDQLGIDAFYRFQETLQEFFDEAAGFHTTFEDESGASVALHAP